MGSATGNEDLRTKGKTDQTKAALKDVGEKARTPDQIQKMHSRASK